MLKVKAIVKSFSSGPGSVNSRLALNGVSFEVNEGDLVSIIGSNGAGKSTLLQAISGEIDVDSGHVQLEFEGRVVELTRMPTHKRSEFIGRVFQNPTLGTASDFSIEENLALAEMRDATRLGLGSGLIQFFKPAIREVNRERFKALLRDLNIGLEDRLQTPVNALSGGQRQALTLAMATFSLPKLLLLDEHCAALDPRTAESIMETTVRLVKKSRITTLMVTHNMAHAIAHSDRLVMMDQGKIILSLDKEDLREKTVADLARLFQVKSDRMLLQGSMS